MEFDGGENFEITEVSADDDRLERCRELLCGRASELSIFYDKAMAAYNLMQSLAGKCFVCAGGAKDFEGMSSVDKAIRYREIESALDRYMESALGGKPEISSAMLERHALVMIDMTLSDTDAYIIFTGLEDAVGKITEQLSAGAERLHIDGSDIISEKERVVHGLEEKIELLKKRIKAFENGE